MKRLLLVVLALCGAAHALTSYTVTPSSLTFASQVPGTTSAAKTITIQNTGNTGLTINSITISGNQPSAFNKTTTCGSVLLVSLSCQVSVTFSPTYISPMSATLVLNIDILPNTNVPLSGIGGPSGMVLYPSGSAPKRQINIFSGPINTSSTAYNHLIGAGSILGSFPPGQYFTGVTHTLNLGCTAANCTGANGTYIDHVNATGGIAGGACPAPTFNVGSTDIDVIVNNVGSLGYINNFIIAAASYGALAGNTVTPQYLWSLDWARNLDSDCVHPDPSLTRVNSASYFQGDYICFGGTFPNCSGGNYWRQNNVCAVADGISTDARCAVAVSPPGCLGAGTTPCNDGAAQWVKQTDAPALDGWCDNNYPGVNCAYLVLNGAANVTSNIATVTVTAPPSYVVGANITVANASTTLYNCVNCAVSGIQTTVPYQVSYHLTHANSSDTLTFNGHTCNTNNAPAGCTYGAHVVNLQTLTAAPYSLSSSAALTILQTSLPIPWEQQRRVWQNFMFASIDAHYKNSLGYARLGPTKGGEADQSGVASWPFYSTHQYTTYEKSLYQFQGANGCGTDFACGANLNTNPDTEAAYANANNLGFDNNAQGTNHAYTLDCYSSPSSATACGTTYNAGLPLSGKLYHGGNWANEFAGFPTMANGQKPTNTLQTTQDSTPGSSPGNCSIGTCSAGGCSSPGVTGSMSQDPHCVSTTFPLPGGYPGNLVLGKQYLENNQEEYFCDAALTADSRYTSLPSSVCPTLYSQTIYQTPYQLAHQAFLAGSNIAPVFTSADSAIFTLNAFNTFTVSATGTPTPAFTIIGGTVPTGLTFSDNGNGTATLSGTPTVAAVTSLTFKAANVAGSVNQIFVLTIIGGNTQGTGSGSGNFSIGFVASLGNLYCALGDIPFFGSTDGPATLPTSCIYTALIGSPSAGTIHNVVTATDLTNCFAGNSSCPGSTPVCGDVLSLQAGASFAGVFTLGSWAACNSAAWLTIETSAPGSLTPEGTRINPSYAGVICTPVNGLCTTGLIGRPAFGGGISNVMTQIITNNVNQPAITFAANVSHVRFIGTEITRVTGGATAALLAFTGPNDHIIFDRTWIHGTETDETRRSMDWNGVNYAAIVDSYLDDFFCLSPGTCTDSQAVSWGGGNPLVTDGTYKLENDFLEAAAENIENGGGTAAFVPGDIEIRENHLFKPQTKNPASPTYDGGVGGHPWLVKNIFELKNAQRVLFEGNILDNLWEGFGQNGNAITLTPKNPTPNLCAVCAVQDVTIRYNVEHNVTQWATISNVASGTSWATAGQRYSIHDLIADGVMYQYRNGGTLNDFEISSSYVTGNTEPTTLPLNNVTINHITVVEQSGQTFSGMFNIRGIPAGNAQGTPQMSAINYTNDLQATGTAVFNATGGGSDNCIVGHLLQPVNITTYCWTSSSLTGNTFVVQYTGSKTWQSGNLFPANWAAVGFVNYNNGLPGGDLRLCTGAGVPDPSCVAGSIYAGTGTDGKNPGANVSLVLSYTNQAQ